MTSGTKQASESGSIPGRIVLDTSAYSHARRGVEAAIDAIVASEITIIPVIVLGELEAGFRAGSRYRDNIRALDEFLAEPFVEVLDLTSDTAARYGETFASLREAGTPIPVNDIWIAAATLASGAHLVTFDRDFSRIPGLPHTVLIDGAS